VFDGTWSPHMSGSTLLLAVCAFMLSAGADFETAKEYSWTCGGARHKPRSSDTVVTELATGCGIPGHSVPYNKQGMQWLRAGGRHLKCDDTR
jgi:hypothetical protein